MSNKTYEDIQEYAVQEILIIMQDNDVTKDIYKVKKATRDVVGRAMNLVLCKAVSIMMDSQL